MSKLEDTGERMVPEFHEGKLLYAEHFIRYQSATSLVKNKVVLDIACGSGYGSKLLAGHAQKVIGVDVNEVAVAYAKKNFSVVNTEFKVGDAVNIPLEDNSVDVVITFETIEHIENYKAFLREINRVLKPDGIAVVSTPNDLEFAEGNHFHIHEFTYDELMGLLKKDFKYIDSYFQATWKFVALGNQDLISKKGTKEVETYNLAPLNEKKYLYFYLVCSNSKIETKLAASGAVGEHYSDRDILQEKADKIWELDAAHALAVKNEALYESAEKARADTEQLFHSAQKELSNIKRSRSYKLALRLSKGAQKNALMKRVIYKKIKSVK